MATAVGTSSDDFIHVNGDGLVAPAGYIDNPGATNGDDAIFSGGGGGDIIHAGGGNDTISFSDDLTGADRISGAQGIDTLVIDEQIFVTFGAASLFSIEQITIPFIPVPGGFLGIVSLTMHDANVAGGASLRVDATALSSDVDVVFDGSAETDGTFSLLGGSGSDDLRGGTGGDGINGGGGRDSLSGGGGGDLLIGNLASDTLRGGAGADRLDGGDADASADTLDGGGDDDTLAGFDGDDLLIGGAGADKHFGDDGIDTASYETAAAGLEADLGTPGSNRGDALGDSYFSIENLLGSAFDDLLAGDSGANTIAGGDGLDRLFGNGGHDVLLGNEGDDYLDGFFGRDTLSGEQGQDTLRGLGDDDTVVGGLGDDLLIGDAGADDLFGGLIERRDSGGGIDVASYQTAQIGVQVDLSNGSQNSGDAAGDRFFSIESLAGSAFGDLLAGNAAANGVSGGDGGDQLFGRGGADTVAGGNGDDQLDGGNQDGRADVLSGGDGDDGLSAFGGNDTLQGGDNDDTMEGGNGADSMAGDRGADLLEGGDGVDTLDGGSGADMALYADAAGPVVVSLDGAGTVTVRVGGAIEDRIRNIENLTGGTSGDRLTGDALANTLKGGAGGDILNGGAGRDSLAGEAGADAYLFDTVLDAATNVDRVVGFAVADDTIRLDDAVFTTLPSGVLAEGRFHIGAAAHDGNDRIIYDAATGALIYDSDGDDPGGATQFATLATGLALTHEDFAVV